MSDPYVWRDPVADTTRLDQVREALDWRIERFEQEAKGAERERARALRRSYGLMTSAAMSWGEAHASARRIAAILRHLRQLT
ncbi:hypothetical protein [Caulobacter segnis]|uniref:Uncharacterized protein n=1 Tax=Caulobacter segnis TaxID=88688 RepID=A0A2W5X4T9_9CAUL|nr:hypothetical protein [Caulobacter segnis]PZR35794.1 MAG: hypothetical protein DI526_05765 [Caulobacter segnis]